MIVSIKTEETNRPCLHADIRRCMCEYELAVSFEEITLDNPSVDSITKAIGVFPGMSNGPTSNDRVLRTRIIKYNITSAGPSFMCLGLEQISLGSLSWAFQIWAMEIFSSFPLVIS